MSPDPTKPQSTESNQQRQPELPEAIIHEAELASGPSGGVLYGKQLSKTEAIARRKSGEDIVVRGADSKANKALAREMEAAVGPPSRPQFPHTRTAGPRALPHFHQQARVPKGHSFYETDKRKARRSR